MNVCASTLDWMSRALADEAADGLRRDRRIVVRREPGRALVEGSELVDFSSNDYLGLACELRVREAAVRAIHDYGWGASASPLVSGYSELHAELEHALADFEQTEAAVVFSSGFAANVGAIASLVGPEDVVFSERRNHASLIDGCRLSRARVHLFDGTNLNELEAELEQSSFYRRRIIVTDSVFSMDGDVARLDELIALADRYGATLYADEAHGTGVLGANGRGAAELLGVCEKMDLRMGTLSKALGSVGGFLACSKQTADWLAGHVRPYVYSTALPSAAAAAALASLEIVRREPDRRQRVLELADRLRRGLEELDLATGRSGQTAIVPVIVGDPCQALGLSQYLARAGFWAVAIRPPSVPEGTCRVRLSLSAAHEADQVDRLLDAISSWRAGGLAGDPAESSKPKVSSLSH